MDPLTNKITLDMDCMKTLASDKRFNILEGLYSYPKTLRELCGELGLSKSTIRYNMVILIDLGLVKKKNYRNKWAYYELTERGGVNSVY